jgi:N-dimethylarginine dimethylaminohydrolase
VLFPEFLAARGFTRIPITHEECEGGHLNVVVTERSRRAVGFAQAVRVRAEMARHRFELLTFPAEELFMGRGGAHCMTCPVVVA